MKNLFYLVPFLLFSFFNVYPQNPERINYFASQVNSVAINKAYIGAGGKGPTKINAITDKITFYDKNNSGLPNNYVTSIATDSSGNKWIGTDDGLAKFDGTTWTVFNIPNSGSLKNFVLSVAIDESGNKWIGTFNGLAKFDGTTWIVFNRSNSGLPGNFVFPIAIDDNGNKWIGTQNNGLAKFDGTTWTVFNTSNSGLPGNFVFSIAIDKSGNKWIGTFSGLAKFDGTTWTVFNTSNSGLPNNNVNYITIDGSGNKWIGTDGGLAVYVQDSISVVLPNDYFLYQNYPNPFNPTTKIRYKIPQSGNVVIKVYDSLGKEIRDLVDEYKSPGSYTINFEASNLSSGIYFYQLRINNYISTKKMVLLR